jgi:protein SCO1/2
MADVVDDLAERSLPITPVMITVDPKRDTVAEMGPALKKHHPDFVGLTGDLPDLETAYDLYSIERTVVFTDPELGDIFAHGSHIYLLDAKGSS